MLVHRYTLVIFVFLEWTWSYSFKITENLPQENDIERKLMEYLQKRKWFKEHRWQAIKSSIKFWKKQKHELKFCKLLRLQQQYLCKVIMKSEKYKMNIMTWQMDKCRKRRIIEAEETFFLKMVACVPESTKDPLYLLSPTGEDEPSLYLFLWEKAGEVTDSDRARLKAKVLLEEVEMRELKRIKKEERQRKIDKFLDYFSFSDDVQVEESSSSRDFLD